MNPADTVYLTGRARVREVTVSGTAQVGVQQSGTDPTIKPVTTLHYQWNADGVTPRARSSKSSRTITSVRPAVPAFFCAPA